jgi:peptidoglycan/xylan/chitin deacetylase (PgdA/CDA1 family)
MSPLALSVVLILAALAIAMAYDFWWRFGMRFQSAVCIETLCSKVFLTFDDGPYSAQAGWGNSLEDALAIREEILQIDPGWDFTASPTQNLQRVLADFKTNAIFFVRGDVLETDAAARHTVAALCADGHVIGNHSFSHQRLQKLSATESLDELERTDRLIMQITQLPVELFRPPYGQWHIGLTWRMWRRPQLRQYALPLGWSHITSDWVKMAADVEPGAIAACVDQLLDSFRSSDTAIVLLQHDVWIYTALLSKVLLQALAREPQLQIGDAQELLAHARNATRRAGPAAIGFYLRARLQHAKKWVAQMQRETQRGLQ